MWRARDVRSYQWALLCAGALLSMGKAWGSPCCSAGSALPALVTTDDLAQISILSSSSTTVMDAPNEGIPALRSELSADHSWVTRISGAIKIHEAWQLGGAIPVIRRSTRVSGQEFQEQGFGDGDFSIAYELLPEWNYSEWRPRGWLYLQTVFPTGKAAQDPSIENPAGVRGQGVLQNALGLALTKSWGDWDGFVAPEIRRLHARTWGENGAQLSGTWSTSLLLSAGRHFSAWRIGLRIQPVFQGQREILASGIHSTAPAKRVWNSGADLSYSLSDQWLIAASYSDQTLLGPARNTTLERSLGLLISRRWEP